MLAHLDQWDAVTGWRVNRAAGDSMVRRVSSRIANRVRNALSDETIQDSGCTFRAFRRECLRDLVLYRGFHRFIPTLLRMRGYRVIEVPVNHRPRRFGQSKYGIGNRAFRAFVDLLVVRWMKDRLLRYEVAEDLGGGAEPRDARAAGRAGALGREAPARLDGAGGRAVGRRSLGGAARLRGEGGGGAGAGGGGLP